MARPPGRRGCEIGGAYSASVTIELLPTSPIPAKIRIIVSTCTVSWEGSTDRQICICRLIAPSRQCKWAIFSPSNFNFKFKPHPPSHIPSRGIGYGYWPCDPIHPSRDPSPSIFFQSPTHIPLGDPLIPKFHPLIPNFSSPDP